MPGVRDGGPVGTTTVDRIAGNAAGVDATCSFPSDGMSALADDGVLGLLVPEAAGGSGGSLGSWSATAFDAYAQLASP